MKITGCPIKPASGFIIVEPYEENEGKSSFIIPDSSKEQLTQLKGKVVAINPYSYISEYGGEIDMPENLKIGDIIIHKSYGSQNVTVQNKKYRIVKHPDIVGIIT